MSIRSLLIPAALTVLVAAAPGRADEVHLKDGKVTRGRVVEETEEVVVVEVRTGEITGRVQIPRENVARIERGETREEARQKEYQKRLAAARVDPSAEAWAELAVWVEAQGSMSKTAREAWQKVLEIDDGHEAARRALGYVRLGNEWMTKEDAYLRKGWVYKDGKWTPGERRTAIKKQNAARRGVAARARARLRVMNRPAARKVERPNPLPRNQGLYYTHVTAGYKHVELELFSADHKLLSRQYLRFWYPVELVGTAARMPGWRVKMYKGVIEGRTLVKIVPLSG